MNKSILLTRTKSSNLILKEKLVPHGFDLVECSLIKHKLSPFDEEAFDKYSNIVITSNFAASNLPNSNGSKYVWVVGVDSEKILKNKDYKTKFCAPDAIILEKELLKNNHTKAIYLSGNNITVEMPSNIKRVVFYETDYKKSLSQLEIQRIKLGIGYILLYSENCAKTLLQLLLENNLLKYLGSTTIVTISSKVGRIVEGYFKNIKNCISGKQIIEFLENIE